mmetsp:Transcript_16283/g.42194  ORF Transcript_16283/g.42194 Transcript_16283/m.42194 type:complete len:253 (+) Transcript_16283:337-1095(+)
MHVLIEPARPRGQGATPVLTAQPLPAARRQPPPACGVAPGAEAPGATAHGLVSALRLEPGEPLDPLRLAQQGPELLAHLGVCGRALGQPALELDEARPRVNLWQRRGRARQCARSGGLGRQVCALVRRPVLRRHHAAHEGAHRLEHVHVQRVAVHARKVEHTRHDAVRLEQPAHAHLVERVEPLDQRAQVQRHRRLLRAVELQRARGLRCRHVEHLAHVLDQLGHVDGLQRFDVLERAFEEDRKGLLEDEAA